MNLQTASEPYMGNTPIAFANGVQAECVLRYLPGKRIVIAGLWQTLPVVAKIFYKRDRAKNNRDVARELTGVATLEQVAINKAKVLTTYDAHEWIMVIYERIVNATSLRQHFAQASEAQQLQLFASMIQIVAKLHAAQLCHIDLHLDNFLLDENGEIYLLDYAAIKRSSRALTCKQRLRNLALLFAQFQNQTTSFFSYGAEVYEQASHCVLTIRQHALFFKLVQQAIAKRKKDYLQRIFRECSTYKDCSGPGYVATLNKQYCSQALLQFIKNPEDYIAKHTVKMLKNGNSATVFLVQAPHTYWVVKRYNIKNLRHFLSRCWRPTRASASWKSSHLLKFFEINVPDPIAWIEYRYGFLKHKSYLVSEYVVGIDANDAMAAVIRQAEKEQVLLAKMRALIIRLHSKHITHGDLKATNIIFKQDEPYLLDLDALCAHQFAFCLRRHIAKDWVRFDRNWY